MTRDRRGRFAWGRQSGRPCGCLDHVNRAARPLLSGEGEALTRKANRRRGGGCVSNVSSGGGERAVEFTILAIRGAADLAGAMGAVADAAAEGALTPA